MSHTKSTNAPFATMVEWQLTSRCNLDCVHCYNTRERHQRGELPTSRLVGTARELARCGVEAVTLSGGEPTLREDWPLVAEVLRRKGVDVQMVTNGLAFGSADAARARRCNLRMVFLSLDGLESTHDVIRRREGSYQRVLRAASLLRREGVPFGFITTVLRRNIGDLRKLAKLVEEQSAQIWSVWLGMSRVEGFGSDMWLSPHESKALLRKLGSLKKSCPPLVAGDNLGSFVCSSHLREASTQPMHGAGAGRFLQCEAGREMLGVRSDGSITGCLSLPSSQDVGSLTEEPLDALWRRAVSARRRRLSRRSGQCLECRFGAQCGAGCHGAALQRGGRVENPYCPIDDRSRSASPRRSVATKAASLLAATTIAAGWGGACTNRPPKSESAARSHGRGEPPGPGPGGVDEKRKKHRSATEEKATWDTEAPAEEHHPVAPTRKKRGRTSPIGSMPSCCMAHVLRPDCRCGGTGLMPSPRPRARPRPRPRPRKPPKP